VLSKQDIDLYLDELASTVRSKVSEESHIKLVLVGGAAIALQYRFRESTMDIDAFYKCEGLLDLAIGEVGKKYNMDSDWLNNNVVVTTSFTEKIEEFVVPYRVFQDTLDVYLVDSLTLVCMKCVSCRLDSHDMEDIKNILDTHPEIKFKDISKRFVYLFGDWSAMKADAQLYLTSRFNMPSPDMVEYLKGMLPPSVVRGATEDEIYDRCCDVYRSMTA
jgi:predicted nucleotidyltransferase